MRVYSRNMPEINRERKESFFVHITIIIWENFSIFFWKPRLASPRYPNGRPHGFEPAQRSAKPICSPLDYDDDVMIYSLKT